MCWAASLKICSNYTDGEVYEGPNRKICSEPQLTLNFICPLRRTFPVCKFVLPAAHIDYQTIFNNNKYDSLKKINTMMYFMSVCTSAFLYEDVFGVVDR